MKTKSVYNTGYSHNQVQYDSDSIYILDLFRLFQICFLLFKTLFNIVILLTFYNFKKEKKEKP